LEEPVSLERMDGMMVAGFEDIWPTPDLDGRVAHATREVCYDGRRSVSTK
jgi:hypothetical protein